MAGAAAGRRGRARRCGKVRRLVAGRRHVGGVRAVRGRARGPRRSRATIRPTRRRRSGPPRLAWDVDVSDSPQSPAGEGRAATGVADARGPERRVLHERGRGGRAGRGHGPPGVGVPLPAVGEGGGATVSPHPSPAVASRRAGVRRADRRRARLRPRRRDRATAVGVRPDRGAQILGVSAGRVIVEVAGLVRGLRGLNVANGSYQRDEGGLDSRITRDCRSATVAGS